MGNLKVLQGEGGGKPKTIDKDDTFYQIDCIIDETIKQWITNNPDKVKAYRSNDKNISTSKNSNVIILNV